MNAALWERDLAVVARQRGLADAMTRLRRVPTMRLDQAPKTFRCSDSSTLACATDMIMMVSSCRAGSTAAITAHYSPRTDGPLRESMAGEMMGMPRATAPTDTSSLGSA